LLKGAPPAGLIGATPAEWRICLCFIGRSVAVIKTLPLPLCIYPDGAGNNDNGKESDARRLLLLTPETITLL